jgi:transposase
MHHVIGCDVHKRYSVFVAIDHRGRLSKPDRVEHERETFRAYLQALPPGSEIAVEATGHWYWIVDEMEQAGHRPHLANPLEAKKRMGKPNKHDALDAGGLAILLRNGTLPESWIPRRRYMAHDEAESTSQWTLSFSTSTPLLESTEIFL